MYNIIYETSCQSRFDAQYWMLGAGALGRPRGMEWGGRREEGSGWGTHVYLWRIHVDIWQNQYNIVKLKKKKRFLNSFQYHGICSPPWQSVLGWLCHSSYPHPASSFACITAAVIIFGIIYLQFFLSYQTLNFKKN